MFLNDCAVAVEMILPGMPATLAGQTHGKYGTRVGFLLAGAVTEVIDKERLKRYKGLTIIKGKPIPEIRKAIRQFRPV